MHVVVNVRKSTLVFNEERVKFISYCPLRISLFVFFSTPQVKFLIWAGPWALRIYCLNARESS